MRCSIFLSSIFLSKQNTAPPSRSLRATMLSRILVPLASIAYNRKNRTFQNGRGVDPRHVRIESYTASCAHGALVEARNPKHEISNKFKTINPNIETAYGYPPHGGFVLVLDFMFRIFVFVSPRLRNYGVFWYSDFMPVMAYY